MDPVVHFEMPYEDRRRMADFYTQAFGWQIRMLGEEMGAYVVVNTTDTGPDGRPKTPGHINGSFFAKPENKLWHQPNVVIAVKDMAAALKRVQAAGGKQLGEPKPIPGIGTYAGFLDTDGNRVSLLQPPM